MRGNRHQAADGSGSRGRGLWFKWGLREPDVHRGMEVSAITGARYRELAGTRGRGDVVGYLRQWRLMLGNSLIQRQRRLQDHNATRAIAFLYKVY